MAGRGQRVPDYGQILLIAPVDKLKNAKKFYVNLLVTPVTQ